MIHGLGQQVETGVEVQWAKAAAPVRRTEVLAKTLASRLDRLEDLVVRIEAEIERLAGPNETPKDTRAENTPMDVDLPSPGLIGSLEDMSASLGRGTDRLEGALARMNEL